MNPTIRSKLKLITLLLLISISACSGSNTPTGTLTFWYNETTQGCTNMRPVVDGVELSPILFSVAGPVACGNFGDAESDSYNVAEGTHTIWATNGNPACEWPTKAQKVTKGTCTLIEFLIAL